MPLGQVGCAVYDTGLDRSRRVGSDGPADPLRLCSLSGGVDRASEAGVEEGEAAGHDATGG
jgi:hypothetical protein